MSTIADVKKFWEKNPLWTGESNFIPGSKDFFLEHDRVCIEDCQAGDFDLRVVPDIAHRQKVLDLGCGIGFWTVQLGKRGCKNIVAADLTEKGIEIARKRCEIFNVPAEFYQQNAESMTFNDGEFSHVNCQGVIHHTPDTKACVSEIYRVLEKGGTANISVYYKNIFLKLWPYMRFIGKWLSKIGFKLKGRGRNSIYSEDDANEIVRLYDGLDNPIGKSYTRQQFVELLEPYFLIEEIYLHFFPARSIPLRIPKPVHRWLDKNCGFMIYASVKKR